MLRYHMIVVTPDNALKRAVKRLTTATGATADFVGHESEIASARPINLAIYDARHGNPPEGFQQRVPKDCRILYILRGEALSQQVSLFVDPRVTSLFCYDQQFDDDEFIASATKALRGDVFGLQKYFPWGVTTFTMLVKNYDEKTRAIDIMMRYAQMAAVRGPVRDRIQLVADELMMNALYHAPTDDQGLELYRGKTRKEIAQLADVSPIQVQYGCSGQYFGISVQDGYGSLTRVKALEYLQRANRASEIEDKKTGAGLGLISVLHSVSKLIFNMDPGYSTEAVALFDMQLSAKGMVGARSLHLFTATPPDEQDYIEEAPPPPPQRSGTWAFAALLGAIVAALGTAYYMKKAEPAVAHIVAPRPTLSVDVEPDDAEVRINGNTVGNGAAWPVPSGVETVDIEITRSGYESWHKSLGRQTLATTQTFYVELRPDSARPVSNRKKKP